MPEQLSLRFEPGLPRPGDVAPMWPVPLAEPFDSGDFLFQPAWGGHRVLAFIGPANGLGGSEVRLVDAPGAELAARLPELAGLGKRVSGGSAVLDGELVVVDPQGLADHEALRERLAGRPGRAVAFLVFDLLHLDGRWLLGMPLEKRRALLRSVLQPGDEVVVVPAIAGEGRALHAAVSAQGIAGILARHRSSPYLPAVRSSLWRSVAAGTPPAPGEPAAAMSPDAGTGPVLALFRRLPLEEPEPDA